MTPQEFISRWKDNDLSERAGAQAHFDDLCDLLGVDKPRKNGEYQFEFGAKKASGGDGWADVWKRGCFGWENKKPGRDLKAALKQLTDYSLNLDNPPLLVVCDRERIEIHTAFTGYPDEPRTILLQDIGLPESMQTLRWVFTDPDKLKPLKSTAAITEAAAGTFADLAKAMHERGLDAKPVAHFLIQCLFCMFAEDEGLLPGNVFTHLLQNAGGDSTRAADRLAGLFKAMRKGGDYGDHAIAHFNGGLFKDINIPPLEKSDLATLATAASDMDWRAIEPAIFGTLFERGLNPEKRSQLGAHYTDVATIMRIIDPVITRPLTAEWEAAKADISANLEKMGKAKSKSARTADYNKADTAFKTYVERLKNFRVLDPACGSGNFLYLALKTLKNLEKRANLEAESLGLHRQASIEVSPANVLGLELEPYAAELARVTVWIGELQWMLKNGYPYPDKPILKTLDNIKNRDALINEDGSEAEWPQADVIIGNPPFLGDKKMMGELGEDYVSRLRKLYKGRVLGGADFVTYWFEKARAQIENKKTQRAGLVATNSIRGGASRKVLERICESGRIFEAWSDEPWINEGAAVRVSLVCFKTTYPSQSVRLDDVDVEIICADLKSSKNTGEASLIHAKPLVENAGKAFIGTQKTGAFDIPGELARKWLRLPNPHGRPSSDVIYPWCNGMDITRRASDTWIIDFGTDCLEASASFYEEPFRHLEEHVQANREGKRETIAAKWWLHTRPRPDMRKALVSLSRFLVTPRVAKYRLFVWLDKTVVPDTRLVVIARSDDTAFGILHSRFHEKWSLSTCSWHGVGNDPTYNAQSCFETFPFPEAALNNPTPDASFPKIAEAAKTLNKLRGNWLNPDKWVNWEQTEEEAEAGFPKRPVAKPGHEADVKKLTLTNLYNQRPAWLVNAHKALDKAVAEAYGWTDYTPEWTDEEILRRLLALNLERARAESVVNSASVDASLSGDTEEVL